MNLNKFKTRIPLARNIDSAILAELFLVNSVLSILAIRVFLSITDYPQLGGGDLHIAHMLWGGVLMITAIFILLFSIGKSGLFLSSILGGLGFGTFIDELGKFITSDNDYFFRPTIAIIYLVFVMLFFIFRYMLVRSPLSPREYLINASDLLKDIIATEDYDMEDVKKLNYLLDQSAANPKLKELFIQIAQKFKTDREYKQSKYFILKKFLRTKFLQIIHTKRFKELLNSIFIFRIFFILGSVTVSLFLYAGKNFFDIFSEVGFFEVGILISAFTTNVIVILGLYRYKTNTLKRLNWFRTSTLFSILFFTFFSFYFNQLSAVFGLVMEILLYYAIDIIISVESKPKSNPLTN
jgi:hypothetical protein